MEPSSPHGSQGAPTPKAVRPAETTAIHTRILRCMLAADDCYAYWQHADGTVPIADRARVAFEQRWFGTKSEARVRTLMTDMVERFDAYPEALALLHELGAVPAKLRPFICHVHTALADPIYREFAGRFLPERREQGFTSVDRATVARWVQQQWPGRWSATTCLKFGSNLLATATDVGLVSGRRDPRKATLGAVPEEIVGYILYLLRDVQIDGSLRDNPYLRSLGVTPDTFRLLSGRVPGVQFAELGGSMEIAWLAPSLRAWGLSTLRADS